MSLLAAPRRSGREEAERLGALQLVKRIERDWADLLTRGMSQGAFPVRDAHTLGLAVLGLIVSVWRWYGPAGPVMLSEIGTLIEDCVVRMVAA